MIALALRLPYALSFVLTGLGSFGRSAIAIFAEAQDMARAAQRRCRGGEW